MFKNEGGGIRFALDDSDLKETFDTVIHREKSPKWPPFLSPGFGWKDLLEEDIAIVVYIKTNTCVYGRGV